MATRKTKQKPVNFSDEDAVLAEVAKKLGEDPEDLEIEGNSGLTGFGEGVVYQISAGKREWLVAESDDAAHALALEVVKQDLEHEPEIFSKDFLESHIDKDRLRRELDSDVREMAEEDLGDMRDREFWRTAERYIDVPEEDDDGDMPAPEDYIDDVAEKMTEERLKDPMDYLSDIYGEEAATMSYDQTNPTYYQTFQPDTPFHPGAEGWSTAPWMTWGDNPNLAGRR